MMNDERGRDIVQQASFRLCFARNIPECLMDSVDRMEGMDVMDPVD